MSSDQLEPSQTLDADAPPSIDAGDQPGAAEALPEAEAMQARGALDQAIYELDQLIECFDQLAQADGAGEHPPWLYVLYPKWRNVVRQYNRATGSTIGRWAHLERDAS